ncbi:MAG: hypothetical protein ACI9QC_000308 [Oceanicoccus sp.]|jgi:hypothetical protein
MPETTPASVKRVLSYASESIFIVALVMVTLLVFIGTFVRVNRLSNVAQYLPSETEAFVVMNAEDYLSSVGVIPSVFNDILGESIANYDWFKRDIALAWVDGELLQFLEVNSKAQAETFLESLMVEGETMLDHQDYKCYEVTQPNCYAFRGSFLILGSSDALESLDSGLEANSNYQNVRHRLPYNTSLFAYVNAQEVRQDFLISLGELSIWEPGYLESVLRIFPAYGLAVKMENDEWTSESFVPVDKSLLDGEAFFHPEVKFYGNLLAYAPEDLQFEWTGTELHSQLSAMLSHLDTLNSAAGIVLNADLQSQWSKYFGNADLDEFGPILNQEQVIAWTPNESFIWMLEIQEEDRDLALSLKDFFLATYNEGQNLEATKEEYNRDSYIEIKENGAPKYFLAVLEDLAIASNNSDYFFESLDRWNGRSDLRDIDQMNPVLLGADQAIRLDMTIFPESHIINLLLPGIKTWISSTKTFDDGIYNRSILQF